MFLLYMLDLDGLLVDTERLHYLAYCQMCAGEGEHLPWNFKHYLQVAQSPDGGLGEAICRTLPQLVKGNRVWPDLYKKKQKIFEQILKSHRIDFMPGAIQLLYWLMQKSASFCVVTNTSRYHVDLLRTRCPPLQMIPKWWTREDYTMPKPSPCGYLAAIKEMGLSAHQTYGFEDSPKGLKSLLDAGSSGAFICSDEWPLAHREPFSGGKWKRYSSLLDWLAIHAHSG